MRDDAHATDDDYDPFGMFERPLPRQPNGCVAILECVLSNGLGSLTGKKIGDLTKPELLQFKDWLRFRSRVLERADAEFADGAETVRVPAEFMPKRDDKD